MLRGARTRQDQPGGHHFVEMAGVPDGPGDLSSDAPRTFFLKNNPREAMLMIIRLEGSMLMTRASSQDRTGI